MKFKKHTFWCLKKGYSMEKTFLDSINFEDESERIKSVLILLK